MECAIRQGRVVAVRNFPGRQELQVRLGAESEAAVNYPELTGRCRPGDWVAVNTTAQELRLGTAGWHYVLAVWGREHSLSKQGHIMKMRYTPLQCRVLSVEEKESPHHGVMADADSLFGLPTAVGSLHSMLAPLAWAVQKLGGPRRLVYIMSDGGALPINFSQTVQILKERGLVAAAVTFGHAFGGDLEAVNIYSALLAAKHVLRAGLAVVLMGPGVVGTATRWGTTAVEQGIYLNAASQLGGTPLAVPRLSEADSRPRHFGLSHHSQTVLRRVVSSPVYVPLPLYFKTFLERNPQAQAQISELKHQICWEDTEELFAQLSAAKLPLSTMGRGPAEDPLFYHGVLAAALTLADLAATVRKEET